MQIILENISKRFQQEWIIKDFSYTFSAGKVYGVKGINGSGKSTLLKILSGALSPSKGKVLYDLNGVSIDVQKIFKYVAYAAAEDELVEELKVEELLQHVTKFQSLSISIQQFIQDYGFKTHMNKQIASFSSGMKQRLKLGLAISAEKDIKLFDEPSSYLDEENKSLFYKMLNQSRTENSLICIASNDEEDFALCDEVLRL